MGKVIYKEGFVYELLNDDFHCKLLEIQRVPSNGVLVIPGIIKVSGGARIVRDVSLKASKDCRDLIKEIYIGDHVSNLSVHYIKNLKKIELGRSIADLPSYSFRGFENLEEVIFKDNNNLTTLRASLFSDCRKLRKIELPKSLLSIESNCFLGCCNLERIEFPSGMISFGKGVFQDCTRLSEIVYPWHKYRLNTHNEVFMSRPKRTIYVPAEDIEYYEIYRSYEIYGSYDYHHVKPIEQLPSEDLIYERDDKLGDVLILMPKISDTYDNLYTGEIVVPKEKYDETGKCCIVILNPMAFFGTKEKIKVRMDPVMKERGGKNLIYDPEMVEIEYW